MKKIALTLVTLFVSIINIAQAPEKFPFQGLATDSNNNPIVNTTINIEIELKTGDILYNESHDSVTTDVNGFFFIKIGEGTGTDDFSVLDWKNYPAQITLTINDESPQSTQLLSVPYALHANSANITSSSEVNSVLNFTTSEIIPDNFRIIPDMDTTKQSENYNKMKNIVEYLLSNDTNNQYIKEYPGQKSIEIIIDKGIAHSYSSLTHFLEENGFTDYTIHDNSGWDRLRKEFTGQIRKIVETNNPKEKNAHEFELSSRLHPALILDNYDTSDGETRASIGFRNGGTSLWRIGMGRYEGDTKFLIAGGPNLSGRLILNKYGEFGFNSDEKEDFSYTFKNTRKNEPVGTHPNNRTQFVADPSGYNEIVFANLNSNNLSGTFITNATLTTYNTGKVLLSSDDFQINSNLYGYKDKVVNSSTGYDITENENQQTFTNKNATGGYPFNLPNATVGQKYRFVVLANQNLSINTKDGDKIRCLDNYLSSNKIGSSIELFCVEDGFWEIGYNYGKWGSYKVLSNNASGSWHEIDVIFDDCNN